MGYTFISTEKGTPAGNEAETCALLHLMCFSNECDEIDQFAIDCFNDVTGMDSSCFSLHDVQSKAGKGITPSKLGADLATLFENFVSEFSQYFVTLTIFVGGVSVSVLENPESSEFGFHDMKPRAQKSVKEHLIVACNNRHEGMFADLATDKNIDAFLDRVRFVVAKTDPIEYILSLARTSSVLLPGERELRRIFAEIRDKQTALKNRAGIAGASIDRPDKVMDFGRVLKVRDIKLLIIERLLNRDFFKDDVPEDFRYYLASLPPEENEDEVLEDCRNELFTQYFDKNDRDAFWTLFNEIVAIFEVDLGADIQDVHKLIEITNLQACTHMNRRSHLYFIAIIKDGLRK
ncbi:hypothetical protein [Arabiibacter massiliensis]|uniref:hypothetical protein n=1 Tax=Arabiibacter massiliensis TaxID=1870985 RepID=UPI001179B38C|nr:hypothetical protein [Arabiibacter massiliensis]